MIDSPVAEVFAFHERDDALPLLSPPFPPVRMISRVGGIAVGARVELRIAGLRWIAQHTAYEKNRLFIDEQIAGPFAKWVHRHEFAPVEGGKTLLTDRVTYEFPGGSLLNACFGWIAKPGLTQMFAHRHRVTKQFCEAR